MRRSSMLPDTDHSPLLRTDVTDDEAWRALLAELGDDWMTVVDGFQDLSVAELLALVPEGRRYPVLVVADEMTFSSGERSLLLVDVAEGRTFRVVPDAVPSVVG